MVMERRTFIKALGIGAGLSVCNGLARPVFAETPGTERTAFLLNGFPVRKQETPYTCGPASVRMALEFLGHRIIEEEIAEKMGTSRRFGTSHGRLKRAYNKYLDELETGLLAETVRGKAVTENSVADSLDAGLPVIASFLTENHFNPGTAVGHFCVIIGVNLKTRVFTLANPFGYREQVDIDLFWRLAGWNPDKGDIPGVPYNKIPRLGLPRTLVVLERIG
jgi:hypothetical protein